MKEQRQQVILNIIRRHEVDTQAELLQYLRAENMDATQATLSRDIRALGLVKVRDQAGNTHYAEAVSSAQGVTKFHVLFADAAEKVDSAGNIVVVKCAAGMANAVCAAMDSLHWESVVGTLAGDDTIFCVIRTPEDAARLADELGAML
ncbi:MAG: arginine repressor [Clostridia bacterium]|nr:arginine repressor [Clostridia bacterium]